MTLLVSFCIKSFGNKAATLAVLLSTLTIPLSSLAQITQITAMFAPVSNPDNSVASDAGMAYTKNNWLFPPTSNQ